MTSRLNFELGSAHEANDSYSRSWFVAKIVFGLSALAAFIWFIASVVSAP